MTITGAHVILYSPEADAVTPLMKRAGYGKGYRYVHNDPRAREEMSCLPESLRGRKYWEEDEGSDE